MEAGHHKATPLFDIPKGSIRQTLSYHSERSAPKCTYKLISKLFIPNLSEGWSLPQLLTGNTLTWTLHVEPLVKIRGERQIQEWCFSLYEQHPRHENSASFQAKSGLNTFLQRCLTVWLILSNPVKMNETCVYPWWVSRQKLHVIVFWVPATPWGFVVILKKEISPVTGGDKLAPQHKTYHLK